MTTLVHLSEYLEIQEITFSKGTEFQANQLGKESDRYFIDHSRYLCHVHLGGLYNHRQVFALDLTQATDLFDETCHCPERRSDASAVKSPEGSHHPHRIRKDSFSQVRYLI